ncbi:MAG: hypothetical protein ABSD10_02740 [Candidatus Saccharimonadales bacterium]|jgi:guanylate kinase
MTRGEFLKDLPGVVKNYRPAPEVLARIKNISLLVVIGPSGVGKSSIINRLGLQFVPSDTTRRPRPEEKEGVDFCFLTDYDQVVADIKAGRFVQVAIGTEGDLYATRASAYPKSGLAVMPVMADVVPIFRNLGFVKTISVFIAPPSYQEWMRRMGSHQLKDEQLKKRLDEARRSLDFVFSDKLTHFILNDDLEKAATQVKQLLRGAIDANREKAAHRAAQEMFDGIN